MKNTDLEKTPLRRCIDTGEVLPKEKLLRFVVSPDGELTPDINIALPGRGIWVTAHRQNVTRAIQKKLFNRFFEGIIKIEPNLLDKVIHLLEERLLNLLCLMRKQSKIVAGFEKLGSRIKKGQVAVMLKAKDSIASDLGKLVRMNPTLRIVSFFTREKLNRIFGGTDYVYCGVQQCGLLPLFLNDLQKIEDLSVPQD
ncbi:MAG: DUF448 domain-containing protein [Alphaproteobacteria bacterium]|nr:DUF448 domain-containing protein [Alphaproteobacteria bacterium]